MADADDITRNPDGSVTEMTWDETVPAVEPSLGVKNGGFLNGGTPSADKLNWPHLALMRWVRAYFQRYVDGSRLLFSSWMSRNGEWSNTGVGALEGFLSDVGGVDSLVADVWVNPPDVDTGAVQMQVSVPKAGPHTFTALMDTYVYVPNTSVTPGQVSEPEMTFSAVGNGSPPPLTPLGTVLVWVVVTDGLAILNSTVLVPPFPIMKQVGFEIVSAGEIMVQGDVEVGGTLEVTVDLEVDSDSTLGNAVGDTQTLNGNVTIGFDGTNTHTVNGSMTGTGTRTSGAITAPSIAAAGATPIDLLNGANVASGKNIVGDGTTSITAGTITSVNKVIAAAGVEGGGGGGAPVQLPEGATIPTGKNLGLAGTSSVVGTNDTAMTCGRVEYLTGGLPPSSAGTGVGADGQPYFGPSSRMHHSTNGYLFATGDQEADSGLFAVNLSANTSVAVKGIGAGDVRVTFVGRMQVSSLPQTQTISLQEDQTASPNWTTIGGADTVTATHDTSDANDWQYIGLERVFAAGTSIPTSYRLRITGGGTTKVKEVRLRVFNERG